MTSKISIHKFPKNKIYFQASKLFLGKIKNLLSQRKKVLIFLSGGSVTNLYYYLAKYLSNEKFDPKLLAFAQVDERFQPEKKESRIKNKESGTEEQINSYTIEQTGLWDICKKLRVPYYLVSQKDSLEEASYDYNKILKQLFKKYDYKIAILGIGEDGHTAGLIPSYSDLWDKSQYSVGYELRGKQGIWARITLTPYALIKIDYALIVMQGQQKEKALKIIQDKKNLNFVDSYPAVLIYRIKAADLVTNIQIK